MPTFTMTKSYDDGLALTEAMLDDMKNSTETFLNTTKLDSTNVQTAGIATANIADNAITLVKMADASVGTSELVDASISTAKLIDASVTQVKRAALGQQTSSSSGNHSVATDDTDVTNLSVSITTTGRPVMLVLISDGTGNKSTIQTGNGAGFKFMRASTELARFQNTSGTEDMMSAPVHIDVPAAGTYTYKIQSEITGVTSLAMKYLKLVAFEL